MSYGPPNPPHGAPPGYPPGGGYPPQGPPGYGGGYGQPPRPPSYRPPQGPRPSMDALAIAAFVLSIISVFVVCCPYAGLAMSVVPLVLAIVSVFRIRSRPTELRGLGFAIASICISIVVCGVSLAATIDFLQFRQDERKEKKHDREVEKTKKVKASSSSRYDGKRKKNYPQDVVLVDMIVHVEVDDLKTDFRDWDRKGGKPDPRVEMFVEGTEYGVRDTARNRYTKTFRFKKVPIKPTDIVTFRVVDRDVAAHDFIGEWTMRYRESESIYHGTLDSGDIQVDVE